MTLLRDTVDRALEDSAKSCGIFVGRCASKGVAVGTAYVVRTEEDAELFPDGAIAILADTSPVWTKLLRNSSAVITERGGELSSLAINARENHVPMTICVSGATTMIPDGSFVKVNATVGKVRWHSSDHHTPYLCGIIAASR